MNKTKISYEETGYFSGLIIDYLNEKKELTPFFNLPHKLESYKTLIEEKQFSKESRTILRDTLKLQYGNLEISEKVKSNIELLNQSNSFTVTTGHQLNLFTGPLYFIYKIISTINLSRALKIEYPDKNFVPIFWLASEDHDFEEINNFNLFSKKHSINSSQTGAIGRMKLNGIEEVFNQLENTLKDRSGIDEVITIIKKYYKTNNSYSEAIRGLVNELFGKYGLIIIDGDEKKLKNVFKPFLKNEIVLKKGIDYINNTSMQLEDLGFKKQVNPREINLFYLKDNLRERIVFEDNVYKVLNTSIQFTEEEILHEIESKPENFSPNAVMRPLYQEVILPNLAYIGGGGELAYWLQLKDMFNFNNVAFPILVLRNSALIIDRGTQNKIDKLELDVNQLFLPTNELVNLYVKDNASINLDLQEEEKSLETIYQNIVNKAEKIDKSLQPMILSELKKNIKALKNIESRLVKAEKQKEETVVNQIKNIKSKLFPQDSLQERKENLLYVLLIYGDSFIDDLIEVMDPFEKEFYILS